MLSREIELIHTHIFSFLQPGNIDRLSYNLDHIRVTPSPIDTRPRLFQPGSLFDVGTYERIVHDVMEEESTKNKDIDIEDDEQYNDNDEHQLNDKIIDPMHIDHERTRELERLSRVIHSEQPMNDDMTKIIMQQLDEILQGIEEMDDVATEDEHEISSMANSTRPYPPMDQSGLVADHDRPYADYGHLGTLQLKISRLYFLLCFTQTLPLLLKNLILI